LSLDENTKPKSFAFISEGVHAFPHKFAPEPYLSVISLVVQLVFVALLLPVTVPLLTRRTDSSLTEVNKPTFVADRSTSTSIPQIVAVKGKAQPKPVHLRYWVLPVRTETVAVAAANWLSDADALVALLKAYVPKLLSLEITDGVAHDVTEHCADRFWDVIRARLNSSIDVSITRNPFFFIGSFFPVRDVDKKTELANQTIRDYT
jgi:hypothetical protein